MFLHTEVLCRSCHVYQTKQRISFSFLTLTSERLWALVWWLCSPIHVWILYFRIIMKHLSCVSSKNTSEKASKFRFCVNFAHLWECVEQTSCRSFSLWHLQEESDQLPPCWSALDPLPISKVKWHFLATSSRNLPVFGFPAVDGHPLLGSSTRCDIQLHFYKQFQAFHVLL